MQLKLLLLNARDQAQCRMLNLHLPPHPPPDALLLKDGGTRRPAQGRPLGYLMAWLAAGPQPQTDNPANHPPPPRHHPKGPSGAKSRAASDANGGRTPQPGAARTRRGDLRTRGVPTGGCKISFITSIINRPGRGPRGRLTKGGRRKKADGRRLTKGG